MFTHGLYIRVKTCVVRVRFLCVSDSKVIDGFWNSLIAMLDDLQQKGMIRGDWHDYIEVANNLEELKAKIADC